MANREARQTGPEPDANAEDLRQLMIGMGVKPAEDENCNVYYVAIQALLAMEKAFYRSAKLGELWLVGSVASLTGGTASVVDWTAKTVDYGGSTVDLANNKFRAPLGTKFVRMTMQVELSDADITANTRLQAFVDFWLGAPFTWSSDISIYILDAETRIAANPDKAVILGFNTADQGTPINNRTSADHGYMRIRLLHSDATDVYTGVTVSAAFEFFG